MAHTFTPAPWHHKGTGIEAQAFDGSWKWITPVIHGGTPTQATVNRALIAAAPTAHQLVRDALAILDADLDRARDAAIGKPHTVRHLPEIHRWTKAARAYLAAVDGDES